jgi:hypothetical protein
VSSHQVGAARAVPRSFVCVGPSSLPSVSSSGSMGLLLKTASVRVSCIQNTQIRGETIAKVFGKVDMFWTYQATGWPHNRAARLAPSPRPLCVRPPWSTSDAARSPIKTPRREKPKYPINFPETHCDPPSSSTRDREGPEALPGTLPERGIATRGLLNCHACLRRDE